MVTASSSGSPRRLVPDVALTPQSKIRDVLKTLGDKGQEVLLKHGYDVGEGFVDVLSQYQTLQHAAETERLRDLDGLLEYVNSTQ
jgi:hypothetical protein